MLYLNNILSRHVALIAVLCVASVITAYGQSFISVGMPEKSDVLTTDQATRLETKLSVLVTAASSGESVVGPTGLVCIPTASVVESREFNDGMSNRRTTVIELTFKLMSLSSGEVVHTFQKSLSGLGGTLSASVNAALNSLKTDDQKLIDQLRSGQARYMKYIERQCPTLLQKAGVLIRSQSYEEAASIVLSIPSAVESCYTKGLVLIDSMNVVLSKQACEQRLLEARSMAAQKRHQEALETLSYVDPLSSCKTEAQQLIREYEKKLDAADKEQWEQERVLRAEQQKSEDKRLAAVVEMAKAYYKSKQAQYNIIVR